MVKIRLARVGNHKRPFYRMVVAEHGHRRDGRFIEIVGTYDPLRQPAATEVKADSVLKWLSKGAQPSDTVRRILSKNGLWAHWRDVQAGKAEIEGLAGRVSGEVMRNRSDRLSKKAIAKIQEEKEAAATAEAEAAAAPAEEPSEEAAEEAGATEAPAEGASDESAEAEKPEA